MRDCPPLQSPYTTEAEQRYKHRGRLGAIRRPSPRYLDERQHNGHAARRVGRAYAQPRHAPLAIELSKLEDTSIADAQAAVDHDVGVAVERSAVLVEVELVVLIAREASAVAADSN